MSEEVPAAFVLALEDAAATLERVGGKGAALARMAGAGLPVPPGFHITTDAYRRFVSANALQEGILAALGAEDASEQISGLFARGAMPEEIAREIRRAYAALGDGVPVAVRSSATAEDLPGMSFAGQQETYLNIRGEAAVVDAVRRCWASLWTARAIDYRQRMGVEQRSVAMGVVVQRMVPAVVAGVLFTANPATGDRSEIVVNASFGLGEALVSGQVTPDTYLVDKASLAVKETQAGEKQVMVVAAAGQGTVAHEVPAVRRSERALSEPLLRELAGLAVRVEQLFAGTPQDIEWAVAEGKCWLLQARPITGLPPAPLPEARWEPPDPGSKWIRRQVAENMPDPLSPLFADLYLPALDEAAIVAQTKMGIPAALMDRLFDRPLFATVNGYAYMRGDVNYGAWGLLLLAPSVLPAMAKLLRGAWLTYWRDEVLPSYRSAIAGWKRLDPGVAPDTQLLQGIRELSEADARYWFAATLALATAKVADALLGSFLSTFARGQGLTSGLFLRGFPSQTLDAQAKLETIARRIQADEGLRALVAATPAHRLREALAGHPCGRPVLECLHAYLDRYGHQIYTLDFAEPTQADDPLPVLLSLKALVSHLGTDARARQAELAAERDALAARTARSLGPLRRIPFRWLLRVAQRYGPYREDALFFMGAAWPTLRRLALELGRRLKAAGSIRQADDVFYLTRAELAAASTARAVGEACPALARLVGERRELREARKRLHPPATVPPDYHWKIGPFDLSARMSQQRNPPEGATLRGFAVSPGRVTAPASVILSPADFDRMEPGTILVCPTTTPAWTSLFAQARGLVTDMGGILAHGSIVAREFGIPAVMGTGNGTQRIRNGMTVTVDGDAGTVTLHGGEGNGDTLSASRAHNPATGEWNDSLTGDYLWTNGNLGEAIPDVMTPCTWSLVRIFMRDAMATSSVAPYYGYGNIAGRFYMNLSVAASLSTAFGISPARFRSLTEDVFGRLPEGLQIPLLPLSRWQVRRRLLPVILRVVRRVLRNRKRLPSFLATAPEHCEALRARIQDASDPSELARLWHSAVAPFFHEGNLMLEAAGRQEGSALILTRHRLRRLVGETDANALLSGLHRGGRELASLGPLLGLTRLARGEIDRATYARQYGHRGPHEFEVSLPRPVEEPGWIDQQLAGLREAPVDVEALLARQQEEQDAAWARFTARYPRKAAAMRRRIERTTRVFRDREVARSEVMRIFSVLRAFVLRAGDLTGHGEALFFLTIDEILALLRGDTSSLAFIPARRATDARYRALPPYPTLIRGRFDPFRWAADPKRRSDVFDETAVGASPGADTVITGFPGAPGVVEGRVRVLHAPEEGAQLQAGEILVTVVTNVGWTPLFPRAVAVVTDVGAPLSHAAIVARELGIPAVVGSGNATMRLRTGDQVRVDGGQGRVEVLRRADSARR